MKFGRFFTSGLCYEVATCVAHDLQAFEQAGWLGELKAVMLR